ncbi:hypothetical protein [Streptosporangium sp. OZ121]|uniref:hypothetical protein n=1 Tax=Streptosporangium sp. OZ121 TaxID=3444183 RepID=UPI003F7996BE
MPVVENFDGGVVVPVTGNWVRTIERARSGTLSLANNIIGNSQTADAVMQVPLRATTLQFWYSVSSESGFDFFKLIIGGVERLSVSGEIGWTQSAVFDVSAVTQVTFRYVKDGSDAAGSDGAYIDDVTFELAPLTTPMTNSFNGGTNATAITAANSGGASGNALTNIVGSPQFSNALVRGESGLSAVNAVVGADTHVDWVNVPPSGDVFCARLYIHRLGVFPGYKGLFALLGPSGVVSKSWIHPAGRVGVWTGSTTAQVINAPVGIPVGQWGRVEYRYTINAGGTGTVEVWTYLDPESDTPDDYSISASIAWPGGKPQAAEFHLHRDADSYWHLDDVAIGPAKLGPAPSTASLRPRGPVGGSKAAHRVASW